jgi:hypothetical protein
MDQSLNGKKTGTGRLSIPAIDNLFESCLDVEISYIVGIGRPE